jgi:hypothetical protein
MQNLRDILGTNFSTKRLWIMGLTFVTAIIHRYKSVTKPSTPVFHSTRLLDRVQKRIRCLHYSLKTEKAYLY